MPEKVKPGTPRKIVVPLTLGCLVWFYKKPGEQPQAAWVAKMPVPPARQFLPGPAGLKPDGEVKPVVDQRVNLAVLAEDGTWWNKINVRFLKAEDAEPADGNFCKMPEENPLAKGQ